LPVELDVAQPVGRLHDRGALARGRKGDARAVVARAEADELALGGAHLRAFGRWPATTMRVQSSAIETAMRSSESPFGAGAIGPAMASVNAPVMQEARMRGSWSTNSPEATPSLSTRMISLSIAARYLMRTTSIPVSHGSAMSA